MPSFLDLTEIFVLLPSLAMQMIISVSTRPACEIIDVITPMITGFILSFTRSLGETGATFIVMGKDVTVPALVVNMVEALAIPAALFTATYLIILSLILLAIIRFVTRR